MNTKLSPIENELYKRTDEVLHYLWDPIDISDEVHARDEYKSYLPQVFQMLLKDTSADTIIEYLTTIETETMGLTANLQRTHRIVNILHQYKKEIYAKAL